MELAWVSLERDSHGRGVLGLGDRVRDWKRRKWRLLK